MNAANILEPFAKAAGYSIPTEDQEKAIRTAYYHSRGDYHDEKHPVWKALRKATGTTIYSPQEMDRFIRGASIREIFLHRRQQNGDIQRPHSSLMPQGKDNRNKVGRETAYCLSCQRMNPITYGYSERITGGIALDVGGPIDLIRTTHETETKTFCAVCGHRVFTKEEGERLDAQEAEEKVQWIAIGIFGFIVVVIIGAMMLSVS